MPITQRSSDHSRTHTQRTVRGRTIPALGAVALGSYLTLLTGCGAFLSTRVLHGP